jgi:hypothetical protein
MKDEHREGEQPERVSNTGSFVACDKPQGVKTGEVNTSSSDLLQPQRIGGC